MKHCTIGSCTRFPTMGEQCVTHWYEIQGKPMPAMVPLTPGGWVDTWRRGAAAKQAAIAQVGQSADPVFKAAAVRAIRDLCTRQQELTADDVWMALERSGATQTHEPRALGALLVTRVSTLLLDTGPRFVQLLQLVLKQAKAYFLFFLKSYNFLFNWFFNSCFFPNWFFGFWLWCYLV